MGGSGVFVSAQTRPPEELGQTVNGFQDGFNGAARDPNWVAVGPGGDCYYQTNGVLQVYVSQGDPNHFYILIKSPSLPRITVQFDPLGPSLNPPCFITSGPPRFAPPSVSVRKDTATSLFLNWFGPGSLEWSTSVTGPYTVVTNAPHPWTVNLPAPADEGAEPIRLFRLVQPSP
jgi:hypothetical protein